jgi:hypothetical protein
MPGQLALAAADIEHGCQALGRKPPCDPFVHVGGERVPSKHGARQPEAVGIAVVVGLDRGGRRLVHPAIVASKRFPGGATLGARSEPESERVNGNFRGAWLGRPASV